MIKLYPAHFPIESTLPVIKYVASQYGNYVKITDTTLRDGLQSFPRSLPTKVKIKVIKLLAEEACISSMEIGSFVDPKKLPNMADTPHLFRNINNLLEVKCWALVPNQHGLEKALESGARYLSFPTSVSETFTKKNINCSVDESLKRLSTILRQKQSIEGMQIRAYISCCPICPEEGLMPVAKIADLAHRLFQMDCDEIFPSDTVGQANAIHIRNMLKAIQERGIPMERIGLHLHGEGNEVLENVQEALLHGVRLFDSSMGELGGCPVLGKKIKGNIPTEQLVPFLHWRGYETGIKLTPLLRIRNFVLHHLQKEL